MEALVRTSPATYLTPNVPKLNHNPGFTGNRNSCSVFANGYPFSAQKLSLSLRKSVIVEAKKKKDKDKEKVDTHSFVPKPDEATGPFPEAVLLKEKKVQEDGTLLPEFEDAEEQKLFEFLNLQLESDLNVEQMRHYEVVYLIHENHTEEVGKLNEKVQDFLREKKGKIWRLNDWGLRRLAYRIKKAKNAHYILMNFELEAKWINDFKSMLDKDERVIRHLVIKRDEAITEDCPPPPEFHTQRAGMDDDEDNDDIDYDDAEDNGEDWDDEIDLDSYDDDDGIILVNSKDDDREERNLKSATASNVGRRNMRAQKVEFFLWGSLGYGLDRVAPNLTMGGPPPVGARQARLDPFTRDVIMQFGFQEVGHLRAIKNTVRGFPRPLLNLSAASFGSVMNKAFRRGLRPPFDPYDNSLNFLLASYLIPYVGLTGYVGANPNLQHPISKKLVAGLLGVESGQDAVIRALLYERAILKVAPYGITVAEFTNRISELRNRLGRAGLKDEGLVVPPIRGPEGHSVGNVLAGDRYSLSYDRTPEEILRIIYGSGDEHVPGGFYPNGANGRIARSLRNA